MSTTLLSLFFNVGCASCALYIHSISCVFMLFAASSRITCQGATAAAADGNSPSSFDFVAADFFTWEPPEKFDVIFDYT